MGPEPVKAVAEGYILDQHLEDRGKYPHPDGKQVVVKAQVLIAFLYGPELFSEQVHDAEGLDGIHVVEAFRLKSHHFTGYFPDSSAV